MTKDLQAKLFERFLTTNVRQGTGISGGYPYYSQQSQSQIPSKFC